ncbi:hypothetical protein RFI_04564 [Reticulomyxa filosa]|uniref:Fe2OG dioxygenase domain-containing protein n=1 Tax=Reticulomyxa filosa TaxID=46433 RepID=X6P2T6_RETFI|nr:hypothetical protein RFI_04564 [Reticulomyxa filosa]|eukprot:ETO32551.1 hypothetical protein RFI_04564 [Reticulomyxa filosa]
MHIKTKTKKNKTLFCLFVFALFQTKINCKLYPKLKESSILDDKENIEVVVDYFNRQQSIAEQCVHDVLELQCLSQENHIKCWNSLFPCHVEQQKIKSDTTPLEKFGVSSDNKETQVMDDKKVEKEQDNSESELKTNDNATIIASDVHKNVEKHVKEKQTVSRVYHTARMKESLSLSNMVVIQYFKDGIEDIPCVEHIDYSLVSLVSANDGGLQVRHIEMFDWIDCNKVLECNGYITEEQKNRVLVVLMGLTLGELLHGRVACFHQVIKSFTKDRISLPFFFYADPCGQIRPSLIQKIRFPLTEKDLVDKNIDDLIAANTHASVNF